MPSRLFPGPRRERAPSAGVAWSAHLKFIAQTSLFAKKLHRLRSGQRSRTPAALIAFAFCKGKARHPPNLSPGSFWLDIFVGELSPGRTLRRSRLGVHNLNSTRKELYKPVKASRKKRLSFACAAGARSPWCLAEDRFQAPSPLPVSFRRCGHAGTDAISPSQYCRVSQDREWARGSDKESA